MTDTAPPEPERAFDPAARQDKTWGPRMMALIPDLSAGDRSTLIALLQNPDEDAVALTSRGSPNDWFWAHLSRVGWMEEAPSDLPDALGQVTASYRLTAEGRKLLPGLLAPVFAKTPPAERT